MYDIQQIRADFPILGRTVYGKPLVYLDNGATTQKPRAVVEAITNEYYNTNANVHRGVHFLSQQATELHEASRETVRRFINARSTSEIVFTRGTTESINLLAASFCQSQMQAGDEVIISTMEHHSNIVPWQLQAAQRGIVVAANIFGKLKTVFQMIAIPLVLLNGWPFSYFDSSWPSYCRIAMIFVYIAAFFSLLSGIIYVYQNRHVLKEGNK